MNLNRSAPSDATLEMLRSLVAFDTTSFRSNLELIDFVSAYLRDLGLDPMIDYNQEKTKANLYVAVGPATSGGIALSGHTDVVPVEGQAWTRDPWTLVEDDGRWFGRGSTDMKGFIAVCLAAVPRMLEAELHGPVHLCFSYDEEVGCLGVRSLLSWLEQSLHKPDLCFVGEPTDMW